MTLRAAAIVCSLLLAAPAVAQTTRAEAIAQQQAEKAQHLAPEGPSRAEQVAVRATSSLGKVPEGFYPWFDTIFPGGAFAVGAGYGRSIPHGSRVNLVAGWSIENYKLLQAEFTVPEIARGRIQASFGTQWIDAPDVAFYGLGPDSSDDRASYVYRPTSVTGNAVLKATNWIDLSGGYSFLHTSTDEGKGIQGRFTPAETPGLDTELDYNVTTGGVTLDTRPSPSYSTRGALLRGTWSRYGERNGRLYSFDRSEYEAAVLVPLVGEQFGVMLRGVTTISRPDEGHQVPIMLASEVGSGRTVRGFHNRRFQDNARVVINAEYRWRPSRYLDMAIFMDLGQVAPRWQEFNWETLETGWGVGSRFHGPSFMVWRIEVAHTRNGMNLIFSTNHPF